MNNYYCVNNSDRKTPIVMVIIQYNKHNNGKFITSRKVAEKKTTTTNKNRQGKHGKSHKSRSFIRKKIKQKLYNSLI